MIEFQNEEQNTFASIKVVGCGGVSLLISNRTPVLPVRIKCFSLTKSIFIWYDHNINTS